MWNQFILQNFEFANYIFASLAIFSVFWLYFDAWVDRKNFKDGTRIVGFLFLSLAFLLSATLNSGFLIYSTYIKNIGYFLLTVSLLYDPIEKRPENNQSMAFLLLPVFNYVSPILALFISLLYLRKAVVGLENHLKKISVSFFLLTGFEIIATIRTIYSSSQNIDIYNLVRPFGVLWITSNIFLVFFSVITIRWAFSYLLKRINTQLYIIFTSSIIAIFIITAISFSFLLLKNMVDETLSRLSTDTSVLSFGIDSKKKEAMSTSLSVSKDPRLVTALTSNDKKILGDIAEEAITTYYLSSLTIIDINSVVVARGEDRDRIGDSLSEDSFIKRSLKGEKISSLIVKQNTLAPNVLVRSSYPIFNENNVIGAVVTSIALDNTFLDGIKKATGLEAGIYSDNILSSTTIGNVDGNSRPIGIKETNKKVLETVLGKGSGLSLQIKILNTDYLASFHPLIDINNAPIGMVFIGKPSYTTLEAVDKSIQTTFMITVILVIVSLLPSYFISKYITNQLN